MMFQVGGVRFEARRLARQEQSSMSQKTFPSRQVLVLRCVLSGARSEFQAVRCVLGVVRMRCLSGDL